MKICIHRGSDQIGGSCVELEHGGSRIVIDLGLPLDAVGPSADLLPPVAGLTQPSSSLLGIIISHPHQDHYGLLACVHGSIPIAMGAAGRRILKAAAPFMPGALPQLGTLELADRVPLDLGPFRITPYLVDHSAYDAYALLIEAGGKRVFYSGDFRAHGRKSAMFEKLLAYPPAFIDCLLLEGTSLSRLDKNAQFETEAALENRFVDAFKRIKGMPLVFAAGQNIDRIVTVYRACKRSNRRMVVDLYTAEVLAATENQRLPQGSWQGINVIIPPSQSAQADKIENLRERHRCIKWSTLRDLSSQSVLLCRQSVLDTLVRSDMVAGAEILYSMWDGYLEDGKLTAKLEALGLPLTHLHTSGHADIPTLKRLAEALRPAALTPIHSQHPGRYADLFSNVASHADGEWWSI